MPQYAANNGFYVKKFARGAQGVEPSNIKVLYEKDFSLHKAVRRKNGAGSFYKIFGQRCRTCFAVRAFIHNRRPHTFEGRRKNLCNGRRNAVFCARCAWRQYMGEQTVGSGFGRDDARYPLRPVQKNLLLKVRAGGTPLQCRRSYPASLQILIM